MKKLFDEDLSLSELKSMIKGLHKKKSYGNIILCALLALLLAAAIALIVSKLHCRCNDDFDDFDYDDDFDDDDFDDDDDDDDLDA